MIQVLNSQKPGHNIMVTIPNHTTVEILHKYPHYKRVNWNWLDIGTNLR